MSGLGLSGIDVCDNRKADIDRDTLNRYDFIILSGGHVPTENAFICIAVDAVQYSATAV